ncbi:MAG: hypothetical protein PF485_02165 [Bacteroidales bacterium]|jgi:hypothetical protein|nr:hypothetical protein [Bacteroidales bacterium]
MNRNDFIEMTLADQGMILLDQGKHLTVLKRGAHLLNLYSIEDFFVEVYYSFLTENIDKIEIVTDYSKIDKYIDENQKEDDLRIN